MTKTPAAVKFGTATYTPGLSAGDFVGLASLTGPELVSMHNELVFELAQGDTAEVKRFADHKTAQRRVWNQLLAYAGAKPETQMKGSVRAADAPHPAIKSITSTLVAIEPKETAAAKKARLAAASGEAIKAKPEAAATARRSTWRRAKHENASKTAYRPADGSVQGELYALLTRPGGITMEDYCAEAAKVKTKDATLFTPPAVWGALRYLFVTNRGYGLDFDGVRLQLLVPADERTSARQPKPAKA